MKCKKCRNTIPENSIFCNWCGARQIQTETEISVPAPVIRNGSYWGRVVAPNGARISVTETTEKKYYAAARAIKSGKTDIKKAAPGQSLEAVGNKYLNDMEAVLSPSTMRGYNFAFNRLKSHFKDDVGKIDYQHLINDLTAEYAPKTVKNTWAFITAAFQYSKIAVPEIKLPTVIQTDEQFLDYEEIERFLQALPQCRSRGSQLAAVLALHGLRLSEILGLNKDSLQDGYIRVRGAVVRDRNGRMVYKESNKNSTSRRDVPVLIPMLYDLWNDDEELHFPYPTSIYDSIQLNCIRAGVPVVSIHDLRRSFASLGYHLKMDLITVQKLGGWSNNSDTLRRVYIKLSEKDKNADIAKMADFYQGMEQKWNKVSEVN